MRVSLRHVAERAGVSRVTASNVLRGRASEVSPATRERVMEAMRQLEYIPVTPPTRQSNHTPTRVIGLLFDYIDVEDTWGARTFHGLKEGARVHDYDLLTLLREVPHEIVSGDMRFLDRRSDGFIFVLPRDRKNVLHTLLQHDVPVVVCFSSDVPTGVPVVTIDDADALRQAVRHLVSRGHRNILHVGGTQTRDDFQLRYAGYREAMLEAGLEPHFVEAPFPMGDVTEQALADQVFAAVAEHSITAAACASDHIALSVWNFARKLGISVPEQLSITGMDDLPGAAEHGLTTIRFSGAEVGRLAVETLLQQIEGTAVSPSALVPVSLVERYSVAAPAGQRPKKLATQRGLS